VEKKLVKKGIVSIIAISMSLLHISIEVCVNCSKNNKDGTICDYEAIA